ncbi:MAG: hypothetical protein Q4C13_02260 [Clostridia bacterium]|nr:hypothetical protein [Clostridia bacterium]
MHLDDERCELNPEKLCDNCFRCLEPAAGEDYAQIPIAAVYTGEDYIFDGNETDVLEGLIRPPLKRLHTDTIQGWKGRRRL